MKILHSTNGGIDWKAAPIKLPRGKLCDKANDDYRKYLMADLHPVSDLPFSESKSETICDKFTKVFDSILLI